MATGTGTPLRPLQFKRAAGPRRGDGDLPLVPEPLPERALAPDRRGPTEDNGVAAPRAELHIALIAPDRATAELLRGRVRVVRPPLWHGGKVHLHVITEDARSKTIGIDMRILQAVVDLGWADAADLEIGPPDELTLGYPSAR